MNAKSFGRRVRIARNDLEMNQGVLATKAGINASYVSEIENGAAENPTIKLVEALAEALDVTVAYLLGYTENPLPENSFPSLLAESHVVYEVEDPGDRRHVQELLDDYLALEPSLRQVVRNLAATLRTTSTPRIIGDA